MVKASGFDTIDPGSNPSRVTSHFFSILNAYAIAIYLSSLKIHLQTPTGLVAQAVSPLGCQLRQFQAGTSGFESCS